MNSTGSFFGFSDFQWKRRLAFPILVRDSFSKIKGQASCIYWWSRSNWDQSVFSSFTDETVGILTTPCRWDIYFSSVSIITSLSMMKRGEHLHSPLYNIIHIYYEIIYLHPSADRRDSGDTIFRKSSAVYHLWTIFPELLRFHQPASVHSY